MIETNSIMAFLFKLIVLMIGKNNGMMSVPVNSE